MVYALTSDEGSLKSFASAVAAVAYCEGIDVAEGLWSFFAEDGSPLEARFERPAKRGRFIIDSGTYTLQAAASGPWLQQRLAEVKSIEVAGVSNVAQLDEHLKRGRGVN